MSTPSLLAALAPVGASYHPHLTLAYDPSTGDSVTVTIILKPREGVKGVREKTFQLAGTIADVEKQIIEQLPAAVNQIVDHTQSLLAQAEAQVAADKKEAEEAAAKKAAAPKAPAAKPSAPAKPAPAPKAKATPAPKPAPVAASTSKPAPAPAGGSALTAAEQAVLQLNSLGTDDDQPL